MADAMLLVARVRVWVHVLVRVWVCVCVFFVGRLVGRSVGWLVVWVGLVDSRKLVTRDAIR